MNTQIKNVDLQHIESEATEKMRALLSRDDIRVEANTHYMSSLYVGGIEVAFCLNEDIESDEETMYRITEPRKTEISFNLIDGQMKPRKHCDIEKISQNISLNLKHQEIVQYIINNNLVKDMFMILEFALTLSQLSLK